MDKMLSEMLKMGGKTTTKKKKGGRAKGKSGGMAGMGGIGKGFDKMMGVAFDFGDMNGML